jgi:hypothetical protein
MVTETIGHPPKTKWKKYPEQKPPIEWSRHDPEPVEYMIELTSGWQIPMRYRPTSPIWSCGAVLRWREMERGE